MSAWNKHRSRYTAQFIENKHADIESVLDIKKNKLVDLQYQIMLMRLSVSKIKWNTGEIIDEISIVTEMLIPRKKHTT